jgi:hypothetical protein
MPSRHQSDRVDRGSGPLRRAALLQIADNLIRHEADRQKPTLAARQNHQGFSRLALAMLHSGQVFGHPSCQTPHAILDKLLDFHCAHATPFATTLPRLSCHRSRYAAEAQTLSQRLQDLNRRRRPAPKPQALVTDATSSGHGTWSRGHPGNLFFRPACDRLVTVLRCV